MPIDDRWQDNWRKPINPTELVREQARHNEIKEGSKKAATLIENLPQSNPADKAGKPAAETPAASPKAQVKIDAQPRPDAQDGAANLGDKAASNFIDARGKAKELKQLEAKTPAADRVATNDALSQKGLLNQPNLTKHGEAEQGFLLAREMARAGRGEQAKGDAAKRAADAQKAHANEKGSVKESLRSDLSQKLSVGADPLRDAKLSADAGKVAFSDKVQKPDAEKPENSEAERPGNKKKSGEAKQSGGVYARPTNAGGELGALLGGFGGSDGKNENADGGAAVVEGAKEPATNSLPELDDSFKVYSEFDEANPGIEMLKSKAQIFEKRVQKLVSIANFDREVDYKIMKLSERIVGDLKDEIDMTRFIYGSVYGGTNA